MTFSLVRALTTLRQGGMVVVADSSDRENEGDLVMAASAMTEEQMVFYLRHGSGIVCVPMPGERADALGLPLMVEEGEDRHGTAFTLSVDHRSVGTGISARDRTRTVNALGDAGAAPTDFFRPGHLFPLRCRAGGVLQRAGHTEASVDLLELAGLEERVSVITELVADDGVPMSGPVLIEFARRHGLPFVEIDDIVRARRSKSPVVLRSAEARMPLEQGTFTACSYSSLVDGVEHVALVYGDIAAADHRPEGVLVRVHSECLTGDVFGSHRCDCGAQLDAALDLIAAEGAGVVVYLRGHEGRGIGITHKLRAYSLQERGYDTVDANLALGLPVDARDYGVGASILADLGVHRARIITNSPQKYQGLGGYDLELVGRVKVPSPVTAHSLAYLRTKRDRMDHDIDLAADVELSAPADVAVP